MQQALLSLKQIKNDQVEQQNNNFTDFMYFRWGEKTKAKSETMFLQFYTIREKGMSDNKLMVATNLWQCDINRERDFHLEAGWTWTVDKHK